MSYSIGASSYPIAVVNDFNYQLPRFGLVMVKFGEWSRHDFALEVLEKNPDVLLGLRVFVNDGHAAFDGQLDLSRRSSDEAFRWYSYIRGPLSTTEFLRRYAWAFGPNETWDNDKPGTFAWMGEFEGYLCDYLQADGIPYACCGAAPGNVDPPDFVRYLGPVANKAAMVCADHYCRPNGTTMDPPDWPYHARRPLEWFKAQRAAGGAFGTFVGKETGTYFSWRDMKLDQGVYINLQKQYAGELYPEWATAGMHVLGNIPFADGCEGEMGDKWNIDGSGRQLVREWNQQGGLAVPTRPTIPTGDSSMTEAEFERYCADIFKRANVAYNPTSAFVKYWKDKFHGGRFLGFPAENEHSTENNIYLVQAFQNTVLYCAKADFVVHEGLPPFH